MQKNTITIENSIILEYSLLYKYIDVLFIFISGYIDSYNCTNFIKELNKLIGKEYKKLIIDCSELNYISSTGIGCFASLVKELKEKNGDVIFININQKVSEVFSLLGVENIFTVKESKEEAIRHFK